MYNKITVTETTEEAKKPQNKPQNKLKGKKPDTKGHILEIFWHYSLMLRKRGGIGSLGSAQTRFFQPSAKIREK